MGNSCSGTWVTQARGEKMSNIRKKDGAEFNAKVTMAAIPTQQFSF